MAVYEALLLNTAVPQIQAAQAGDSYVMVVNATTPALRITQTGTGNAISVEDEANPDSSPFVVTAAGDVGIGTNAPTQKLTLVNNAASTFLNTTDNTVNTLYGTSTGLSAGLLGTLTNHPLVFYANNGEKMRLDTSGNLGLGVTPSAWFTSNNTKAMQLGGGSFVSYLNNQVWLANNYFLNSSGQDTYVNNGAAMRFIMDGAYKFQIAPSGTAGATTSITSGSAYSVTTLGSTTLGEWQAFFSALTGIPSIGQTVTATATGTLAGGATVTQIVVFTQAMTLDASGNLGVGTTSPGARVDVSGSGSNAVALIQATRSDLSITTAMGSDGGLSGGFIRTTTNHPLVLGANNAERARITSGGYFKASDSGSYIGSTGLYHELRQTADEPGVQISATNAAFSRDAVAVRASRNTTNNSFYAISYYNDGAAAYKFRVADSGDVTNTNGTYGTISDQKMKTDIVDAGSQWADIKSLRFRKFKMKDDPSGLVQLGVVAQEVELTSPGLVDEHQDRDAEGNDLGTTTKSVKTSVLLMKAAVALQEAMARIETLEAKIAALEAK
jgi:hypothetical protein